MNLIQTLTKPNDTAVLILSFIFAFAESFVYYKFFSHILHIEPVEKYKKYLYILFSSLVAIITSSLLTNLYILNPIIFLLSLHILFKQNIKNTFVAFVLTYISFYMSSCIVEILSRLLFNISMNDVINIPLHYSIITTVILCLGYFFAYIRELKSKLLFILSKIPLNYIVIINFVFGIIAIFIQSRLFSFYKYNFPLNLIIINISSLAIYFLVSAYGLIRTTQLEQTKKDLETEKIYNKTLSLLHDNIRCFKHDFNNIVQSIGGYVALNDMERFTKILQ